MRELSSQFRTFHSVPHEDSTERSEETRDTGMDESESSSPRSGPVAGSSLVWPHTTKNIRRLRF